MWGSIWQCLLYSGLEKPPGQKLKDVGEPPREGGSQCQKASLLQQSSKTLLAARAELTRSVSYMFPVSLDFRGLISPRPTWPHSAVSRTGFLKGSQGG